MLFFQNIHKTFNKSTDGELKLYNNLNLQIDEGEFVSIIGSNGSGKSTLFNILC